MTIGRRAAAWCLAALVLVAACGDPSDPASEIASSARAAPTLHCRGTGSPTLVTDAGLGESSENWETVAAALSESVRVCTYDRPGYGDSPPGPFPRSPEANVASLRAAVEAAGLEAPFVLAGHSLGALNAQVYWKLHPEDLSGLVLLDPPPRGWLEQRRFPGLWEMAVAAGADLRATADNATADGAPEASFLAAVASEHTSMLESASAIAIDSFGDLPLLVVAAGRPNPGFGEQAEAYQAYWVEESRALAARSSQGRFHLLEGVGHAMKREAPDVVTGLIREFLTEASAEHDGDGDTPPATLPR